MASDIRVSAHILNDHIATRMLLLRMGHGTKPSVRQLVERMGYGSGTDGSKREMEVRDLVHMKTVPTDEGGQWKPVAVKMAETLKTTPDDLWPGMLKKRIPSYWSKEFTVAVGEELKWLVMAKKFT